MKNNKGKILLSLLVLFIAVIGIIYYSLSSGEILEKEKTNFLTDRPIAHRGLFDNEHPENSLKAFENSVNNNYVIELDVQFTKDKKVVVFHDANLERMTKDKRNLDEVNYEELKNLKLSGSNEMIPLLKDVLETVDGKVPILIEIKDCKDIIELGKETYNITKNYEGQYAVQSFNPFVLEWYKNNANEVLRGQLSGTYKEGAENLKIYEKFALKNLLLNFKSKPNFISYELDGLPNFRVNTLKKQGMPILTWTVENKEQEAKAYKYADNIIFDKYIPSK